MADWAAEWAGAKDVFKDATKMDKPENAKKFMGVFTNNGSNISSALKKVDAEFKKHDAFLKMCVGAKYEMRDKLKAAEEKIVVSTRAAINEYRAAAKAYTPKLTAVIDGYKAEKKAVKDQQAEDKRNGKALSPEDVAKLKTSYVRGIQLLDKQLTSITTGMTAEFDAFQKKAKAAQAWGDGKAAADNAVAKTALPLARAAVKKALAFTAQAKAVVGGNYAERKEWEPARLKALRTLHVKTFADIQTALKTAEKAAIRVPDVSGSMLNPNTPRWNTLINDTAKLDWALSEFAKDLKWLDAKLVADNK